MIDIETIIAHCKELNDRRMHIDRQFKSIFNKYWYYTDYDRCDLNDSIIDEYYSSDFTTQQHKLELWSPAKHESRILRRAEISLTIKHYKIMKYIAESGLHMALVFEDDVILCEGFERLFDDYLSQTPKDFDVIFFGSGAGLRPDNVIKDQKVYLKKHPASKCTDSYLITNNACEKMISSYMPFHLCVDFEMAYQMHKHDLKVYWWEPSLVKQGSENGLFNSTLR